MQAYRNIVFFDEIKSCVKFAGAAVRRNGGPRGLQGTPRSIPGVDMPSGTTTGNVQCPALVVEGFTSEYGMLDLIEGAQ